MTTVIFFVLAVWLLWWRLSQFKPGGAQATAPRSVSPQLTHAITYADRLYKERRFVAAESAYVAVLKLDHKNVTAYNRLGIIYSAQKNYPDAVECFEIASRLTPSAQTFLNLGLAHYEHKAYNKAVTAIRRSIGYEPSMQRYMALAKACKGAGDNKGMISALEQAVELEPTRQSLTILRDAYRNSGRKTELAAITERLKQLPPAPTPRSV